LDERPRVEIEAVHETDRAAARVVERRANQEIVAQGRQADPEIVALGG
jgi:hypothetical protein